MGGSEDGDGKGEKRYGVMGIIDGPDSESAIVLVVEVEESGGEELLAGLNVDVTATEEDNDCGELVDGEPGGGELLLAGLDADVTVTEKNDNCNELVDGELDKKVGGDHEEIGRASCRERV